MLEPYGEEPKVTEVYNDFDLIHEIPRGALYAGGERADNWWNGFAFGARIMILLIAGLFVYGVLKEFVETGNLWKVITIF